ncbi:MAG: ABC transporter ATP-binding protein [Sulfurovaceae bacterium]
MILEAKNISFSYGKKEVLKGVDFYLKDGDILSLLGKNGCGKTTLLKILLGICKSSGEIKLYGKDLKSYSRKDIAKLIAYIPQVHKIPFDYTVFDVVLMGRLPHIGLFSKYSQEDKDIALNSLKRVGMESFTQKIYSKISGGERQLVFIARAIAQNAKIIFMDEPINGLDYGNQIKFLKLLKDFQKEGYTFLKTTHYPDHALYASNRITMIQDGAIFKDGSLEELNEKMRMFKQVATQKSLLVK